MQFPPIQGKKMCSFITTLYCKAGSQEQVKRCSELGSERQRENCSETEVHEEDVITSIWFEKSKTEGVQ